MFPDPRQVVMFPDPRQVVAVLPPRSPLDPHVVDTLVAPHVNGPYVLTPVIPVHRARRRSLARLCRVGADEDLLQPRRCPDGTLLVAAGRLTHLDLPRLARAALAVAQQRWWTWKHLVADGTPLAVDWQSLLAQHEHDPRRLPLHEARRRYEAQPRVTTMLALRSAHAQLSWMDPDELPSFQAGQTLYCTLAWQQALVGRTLVLADATEHGHDVAYRPRSGSLTDRIGYLRACMDVLAALPADRAIATVIPG